MNLSYSVTRSAKTAFDNPLLQPFYPNFNSDAKVVYLHAQEALVLESEITDVRSTQSLVALLHFEDHNPELCVAAVKAYSDALWRSITKTDKSPVEKNLAS